MDKDEVRRRLRSYQEQVTERPADIGLRLELARFLAALSYRDQAAEEFELCAKLYIARGEVAQAIRCARKVLDLAPLRSDILLFLTRFVAASPAVATGIARPLKEADAQRSVELSVLSLDVDIEGMLEELDDELELPDLDDNAARAEEERRLDDHTTIQMRRVSLDAPEVIIDRARLAELPVFSALAGEAFMALVEILQTRRLPKGERLFPLGNPALCVLVSGEIAIESQAHIPLRRHRRGAVFGELPLSGDETSQRQVRALTPSELLVAEGEALGLLLARHPRLRAELFVHASQQLVRDALSLHPLFSPLPAKQRERLAKAFKSREYERGEVLVAAGARAQAIYLILEGQAIVEQEDEAQLLCRGDFFGINTSFLGRTFTATIRAARELVLLHMEIGTLMKILEDNPDGREQAEAPTVLDSPLGTQRVDYHLSGLVS